MIINQNQHHWLRDFGMLCSVFFSRTLRNQKSKNQIEQEHKRGNKTGYTKIPREAYCRLTKDQMQSLIEYVTPHAKRYQMHAKTLFDQTPRNLMTDNNGNTMKWHTFKRIVEQIRGDIDGKAGQAKYIIIRMFSGGKTAEQIIDRYPTMSRKYVTEIIRQVKKARENNDK